MIHTDNYELKLASDFVQYTGKNIFLTGRAGTGKTTFLRRLKENTPKRMIVVAPTGVAAINAGGTTIHSMFQLPFGPFLPEYQRAESGFQINRFNKEKINILRSLDLLVIDEISMVRADLLDGIDAVLRRFRNRSRPFGGAQLLMIGDLHQLAPVAKDDEWKLLKEHYETPYFFSSKALSLTDYVSIELQQVYRQNNPQFVALLNKIRDNCLDQAAADLLNRRYIPHFTEQANEGYITLTTHNYQAQRINAARLEKIEHQPYRFKARIEGDFPEYSYPTDYDLCLKKDTQVMFVKNDSSPEKRYFNGKIGKIVAIGYQKIMVKCDGEKDIIIVEPETWENMRYEIDKESQEIKETKAGSFMQYPLKTAWAITVHKSQGLTFEKAIIDVNAAFSHGQVYVALSRCKSLEGLVLTAPLYERSIINDTTVISFIREVQHNIPSEESFDRAKVEHQFHALLELFDFSDLQRSIQLCRKICTDHPGAFRPSVISFLGSISNALRDEVDQVAEKFKAQIYSLSAQGIEGNKVLQERIQKGSVYFLGKLQEVVGDKLQDFSVATDNKQAKKQWNEAFDRLFRNNYVKTACLIESMKGFDTKSYFSAKAKALLDDIKKTDKKQKVKKEQNNTVTSTHSSTTTSYPELFETLQRWRTNKASEAKVPAYVVLHQKSVFDLIERLPDTVTELNNIIGFGTKKTEQYGKEIIEIIRTFKETKGIRTNGRLEF